MERDTAAQLLIAAIALALVLWMVAVPREYEEVPSPLETQAELARMRLEGLRPAPRPMESDSNQPRAGTSGLPDLDVPATAETTF